GGVCVGDRVGERGGRSRPVAQRGFYPGLGGTLSPLAGVGPEDLNVSALMTRLHEGTVREVILALGATVEGATTMHWLMDQLEAYEGLTISRVAQGVPMGGALDVLDDGTLAAALGARRPA
ncbi:toprim domain-containing protein, partial [Acetobacter sp.]|uniref:toprim domain-containing protein n=1 Tax=Acetobacter sp. TaxID=440 RepID=UPI0039E80160